MFTFLKLFKVILVLSVVQASLNVHASSTLQRRTLRHAITIPENKKLKVAFFDADSTLRITRSGKVTPLNAADVVILPEVSRKIKELNDKGFFIAIVSNQGGIPKHTTLENADLALAETAAQIESEGAKINYFDFAENYDSFRKPNIGMAQELFAILSQHLGTEIQIDLDNSIMVGDAAYKPGDTRPDGLEAIDQSNSDRIFAENLGIHFAEASEYFGWKTYGIRRMDSIENIQNFFNNKKRLNTEVGNYFYCQKLFQ